MTFLFRNPRFLALTLMLMVFVGMASFRLLPNSEDPELIPRFVAITTRWPGANAERVDSLVTEKIEQKIEEVEEVKELASVSRAGFSFISVAFKDHVSGERLERAVTRAQEKLSQVQPELPAGASVPELNDNRIGSISMIAAVVWQDDSPVQQVVLSRYGEELSDTLRRVTGTSFVSLYGQAAEEVLVDVDPDQLSALGLTPAQLSEKIRQSDSKVVAGQIQNESSDMLIEVGGEFESLDEIRQTPIAVGPNGRTVWLSDIATVRKGIANPPNEIALIDGRRGVAVAAQMDFENQIERWTRNAYAALEKLEGRLPAGVGIEVLFEQNQYTRERLTDLGSNLIAGVVLVLLATFIMMGWRSSVIVAAALPLSVLLTLAGMKIVGLAVHQMSIIGLIIALGLLIDNAIIIVDEITRRLKSGKDAESAITESVKHLGLPLLGSTLTTVLAFTPLALMPGPVGDFCRAMAITVILALSSSLLVSLTIIPILVGVLRRRARDDSRSLFRNGISSAGFLSGYRRFLQLVHARPLIPVVCVPLVSLLGFYCSTLMKQEFFPFSDRDHFPIQLQVDATGSIENTRRKAIEVRQRIIQHPEVKNVHWFVGTNAPNFFYNMGGGSNGNPNYAQGLIQLHGSEGINDFIINLQQELDVAFPGAQIKPRRFGHASKPAAAIGVSVKGPDLDQLRQIGDEIRQLFASIPGVTHTATTLEDGQPKFVFQSAEEEVQVARFSNVAVAQQLSSAMTGAYGGSMFEETEEAPIRVRLAARDRRNLNMVNSVNLLTGSPNDQRQPDNRQPQLSSAQPLNSRPLNPQQLNRWVPLSGLGEMKLVPGVNVIPRLDGERSNSVLAYVPPESNVTNLGAFYRDELKQIGERLPPGYSLQTGGEEENSQESLANVMAYVGLLMIIMMAALVVGMQSFRLMIIIACVAVMSMGFGFAALLAFDIPFGFGAVVGLVGLTGVAINDSIVVLAAMHAEASVRKGELQAACDVVVESTRHVLATSLTTMAGLTPLLIMGDVLHQPMAVAIGGGVFAATGLALLFSPAAYLLIMPTIRGFSSPETA